jgi:sugar phosphate isomerase/epimerase
MLSISTAFNIYRHKSWQKLLDEFRKLGFKFLELNVETPEEWFEDIKNSVARGEIGISSLHNFCPKLRNLPAGRTIFSGYLLTSDDADERELAVRYTKKTIDWASELGAKKVVVHAGDIPTEPSGHDLFNYISQFGREGRLYRKYVDSILIDREKKSAGYMDLLLKGLDPIISYAAEKGIMIGLENRFYVNEIPNIEETAFILKKFAGGPVGYWHDTGHAEIAVRLGFVASHDIFLKNLSFALIGMHLHDVSGISDHFAPGCGDLDFGVLKPYVSDNIALVIEAHQKSSVGDLVKGLEYLKTKGII